MHVTTAPIRIAVVNDYEMVVAGVAAMLAPHHDRVAVVELESGLPVLTDVDVILYDTFGQVQGDGVDLEELVHGSPRAGDHLQLERAAGPRRASASARAPPATCPRSSTASRSWPRSRRCTAGKIVLPEAVDGNSDRGDWPGREAGLSNREAEVMALITQGLSNQEIADRSYLSINSVKTYIRSAYRKIGVTRRAQAVVWGMQNGFQPDRTRVIDPDEV